MNILSTKYFTSVSSHSLYKKVYTSLSQKVISNKMSTFYNVPEKPSFPQEEEKILEFWSKNDLFKKSFEISANRPPFSFYDGPPFATGLPHYGHILAGTMKDIVVRYAFQTGYSVERRFGWDCHGLPVEYEIDKLLGISSRNDVLKLGIGYYNQKCREIVMRYSEQWRQTINRLGRWIDFDNDYKTMDMKYMESCWWACKCLFDNNLIYKNFKVMPFSTACSTPLSNFEVNLNYKDVNDPSITISFPLIDDASVDVIAWTTTPWTLISNLALAVHPEFEYITINCLSKNKKWLIASCRLNWFCQELKIDVETDIVEINRCKGIDLIGKKYKPIFDFLYNSKFDYKKTAFRIISGNFITDDTGTGIVHCAPAFGEEDFNVCLENKIYEGSPLPCPIDDNGCFTDDIPPYAGLYFKKADPLIKTHLKSLQRLLSSSTITHNYPHCWRSDSPLLYRAVRTWFINVEKIKQKLINTTKQTNWIPLFVKQKRFQNWINDAKDWCFSRNRFWGTPIPIWLSDDEEVVICIGSIEELQKYTKNEIVDIHREFIDDITIPDPRGDEYPPLKRVDEVFDCWFESGSMPYARLHYPFENQQKFLNSFPADFIGEGIDQTRGWFYTLMVLSTALFDKPAFKNLIATGLVLAEDGKKMSKRMKNYPDPTKIANNFGADALRIYLINSPVVRGDTLKFKELHVKEVVKDVILPWFHAYRFFIQEAIRLESSSKKNFKNILFDFPNLDNIMDKWIISYMQQLIDYFHKEMSAYRLYTIVPKLLLFLDQLTNWYVRLNRDRMKGKLGEENAFISLSTLYIILFNITCLMTPYCPFICEYFYQNLKNAINKNSSNFQETINYVMLPKSQISLINQPIETQIEHMQTVINMGRLMREKRKVPRKTPLKLMTILHVDSLITTNLSILNKYIEEELNVQTIEYSNDMSGIKMFATPNFKNLGARLGKDMKNVQSLVKELNQNDITKFIENGYIEIGGYLLKEGDLVINRSFIGNSDNNLEVDSDSKFSIIMDFTPNEDLQDQAKVREVVNRIQKLRKKFNFNPMDEIDIWLICNNKELISLFNKHSEFIISTLRRPIKWVENENEEIKNILITTNFEFEQQNINVYFTGFRSDMLDSSTNNENNELSNSVEKMTI